MKDLRLKLELCSGEVVRRLVDVKRSELSNLNDIEFLLCDRHNLPGALLKKNGQVIWTTIAARTRSSVSCKDNYTK